MMIALAISAPQVGSRPEPCVPFQPGATMQRTASTDNSRSVDNDRAVDLVRNLLAKAASSEFEAESEAFEAKAMALMAEHEIAERDLREPASFNEDFLDLTSFGRAGKGAACLASWLTDLFGGYAVLVSKRDGKAGRVMVLCTPSQRERLDVMLDHLLPQLRAALTADKPRSRMSYSLAWAAAVLDRLRAAQAEAYQSRGALVPTGVEARNAYEADYGRASETTVRVDSASAMAGTTAGHEADLGQERLTD